MDPRRCIAPFAASTFGLGLIRLQEARIARLTVQIVLSRYHLESPKNFSTHPYSEVLAELAKVSYSEFDSFRYVSDASYLVYATTLLDTFLTDTTRFILLLNPGAIGDAQSVSLKALLSARSRSDLITQAATKKAREISYLPFLARLEYLRRTFGLSVTLDEGTTAELAHYADVRNVIVHDQGVFDVDLDDVGTLRIRRKTCPRHPTPVTSDDLDRAKTSYIKCVREVYRDVMQHVLRAPEDEAFKGLLSALSGDPVALGGEKSIHEDEGASGTKRADA